MRAKDICPREEVTFLLAPCPKLAFSATSRKRRHRRADGTIVTLQIMTNSLVFDGSPARLVTVREVTNRTRLEDLLQRSVKEISGLSSALDASSIVAITDQKGIIKYVNDKFCQISEYSRAEITLLLNDSGNASGWPFDGSKQN